MENTYYKVAAANTYEPPTAEYVFASLEAAVAKFDEMRAEEEDQNSEAFNCDALTLSRHVYGEEAREGTVLASVASLWHRKSA